MDVRCEKCATEYELEESRLKPGGVTVKCTTCGHIFQVRRRQGSSTSVGVGGQSQAPARLDTIPAEMEFDDSGPTLTAVNRAVEAAEEAARGLASDSSRVPRPTPSSARARRAKERNWLIRLPSGDIEVCRALSTLQQWIISGRVTRQSGISRSGKTWKRLGEIEDLASFFEIADEAREARRQALAPTPGPHGAAPDAMPADERSGPVGAAGADTGRTESAAGDSGEVKRTLLGVPTAEVHARVRAASARIAAAAPEEEAQGPAFNPLDSGPGLRLPSSSDMDETAVDDPPVAADEAAPAASTSAPSGAMSAPGGAVESEQGSALGSGEVAGGRSSSSSLGDDDAGRGRESDAGGGAPEPALAAGVGGASADGAVDEDAGDDADTEDAVDVDTGDDADADADAEDAGDDTGDDGVGDDAGSDGGHETEADQAMTTSKRLDGRGDDDDDSGPVRLNRAGLAAIAAADERQGPARGVARGAVGEEVAFRKGSLRVMESEHGGRADSEADPLSADDAAGDSGVGRWIAVVALGLIAASAIVVYMLVFRHDGAAIDGIQVMSYDAGAEIGVDGGEGAMSAAISEALAQVESLIMADNEAPLRAMKRRLEGVAGDSREVSVLVARARVGAALAQMQLDRVQRSAGSAEGKSAQRAADKLLLETLTLAQRALQGDRESPDALAAMADVLRLQGQPMAQIEGYLTRALERLPEHREARRVRALAMAGQQRERSRAREILTALATVDGDVRAWYRLAILDVEDEHVADAKRRLERVLEIQPAHEGAAALLARLGGAIRVDTNDPLPPEEAPKERDEGREDSRRERREQREQRQPTDRGSGEREQPEPAPERPEPTHEQLLEQATSKRRAGQCEQALALYEQALDSNPSSAPALVGAGLCSLDGGRLDRARGQFLAALGVAPRHPEAMWSLAEIARRQGQRQEAVRWYRRYLDDHPSGSYAAAARRQLEALEPSPEPPPDPEPPAPEPQTPAPPATPEPTPTDPAPPAPGSETPAPEPPPAAGQPPTPADPGAGGGPAGGDGDDGAR